MRKVIGDGKNQIYVSVANAWETSIKNRNGKLPLKTTLKECFNISTFAVLNIDLEHILMLDKLPLHHKDPFDRILIAQAKAEGLILITSDQMIWKYELPLIKA